MKFQPRNIYHLLGFVSFLVCIGCAKPQLGPDKQGAAGVEGMISGAGAGAITGAQLGSATGPGALAGAGLGAIVGGLHGSAQDSLEQEAIELRASIKREEERTYAQDVLTRHYARKLELHPTRDIFPADLFFANDESVLRPGASAMISELAKLTKQRLPWSRMALVSYVKASDKESEFSRRLADRRAKQVVNAMVGAGVEPRRLVAKSVLLDEPILVDADDDPMRYNQAIELVALDR